MLTFALKYPTNSNTFLDLILSFIGIAHHWLFLTLSQFLSSLFQLMGIFLRVPFWGLGTWVLCFWILSYLNLCLFCFFKKQFLAIDVEVSCHAVGLSFSGIGVREIFHCNCHFCCCCWSVVSLNIWVEIISYTCTSEMSLRVSWGRSVSIISPESCWAPSMERF